LSFRGHDEKWRHLSNGNVMELVELIAEFDPLLHERLEKYENE